MLLVARKDGSPAPGDHTIFNIPDGSQSSHQVTFGHSGDPGPSGIRIRISESRVIAKANTPPDSVWIRCLNRLVLLVDVVYHTLFLVWILRRQREAPSILVCHAEPVKEEVPPFYWRHLFFVLGS